jgi:very-short-patch-repair endonuclease
MSPPEVKLWQYLRTRPEGLKFRHQHPIGFYSLDFYCASSRLAVEVDGTIHGMADNPRRDECRDAWLKDQGIVTLRISAADVFREFEAVVRMILQECSKRRR